MGSLFSFQEPTGERTSRPVFWELEFRSGERICAPTFADGRACIVFNFDAEYSPEGLWRPGTVPPVAIFVGPTTEPGPSRIPARASSVGAYLRAGSALSGAPLTEFTNRMVPLEDLWGTDARTLQQDLQALPDEGARLARLEAALVERMSRPHPAEPSVDVARIASWILAGEGRLSIRQLADAAGLSRQHFTRLFHAAVGVSPKVYGELTRFQSTLGYLGRAAGIDWAQVAADAGYADQSHMIAEFRRFSGMTPEALRRGRWFHPFIERSAQRFARVHPSLDW